MATVLRSQLEAANLRRSQDDGNRLIEALLADGSITVEDDPAPPEPEPALDADGEAVVDDEGNPVLQAPEPTPFPDHLEVQVDAEDKAAEEAEEAAE